MFFVDCIMYLDFRTFVLEREIHLAHPFSGPRSKISSVFFQKVYLGIPAKKNWLELYTTLKNGVRVIFHKNLSDESGFFSSNDEYVFFFTIEGHNCQTLRKYSLCFRGRPALF